MCDFDDLNLGESYSVDTNGDGYDDTQIESYDTNGDGYVDEYVIGSDTDGDGAIDDVMQLDDTDGDGVANTVIEEYYSEDGSHHVDSAVDTNGDGIAEGVQNMVAVDTDGNGAYDALQVSLDVTGDGYSDSDLLYAVDERTGALHLVNPDVVEEDDNDYHLVAPPSVEEIMPNYDTNETDSDMVSGDPESDMVNWEYQGDTNRCALYSQKFVIESLTGEEVDIDEAADYAERNGWFSEDYGTSPYAINKLLDAYGVENEMSYNNNITDIKECLDNGGKVIVSLNCEEIWGVADNDMYCPYPAADHAVEVIGIDYSNPNEPMVVLNDSGNPDGCGEMVPLSTFEHSWSTSNEQMVACYA